MELLSTEEVLAQTQLTYNGLRYLRRKFAAHLQPVRMIGPTMMWDPGVIERVHHLKERINHYKPRKKKEAKRP